MQTTPSILAGQNLKIKVANHFFPKVIKILYLGTIIWNLNYSYEKISSRWKWGIFSYLGVRINVRPVCRLKYKDQNTHKYESNMCIALHVCEPSYW